MAGRREARFSSGPAFICGDASRVHVSIGGQGRNTGLQDAFNLAEVTRGQAWTLLIFSGLQPVADDTAARRDLAADIVQRFGDRIAIFGVEASPIPAFGIAGDTLLDVLRGAHERYGVADPAFYLLRPDTYVAARGPIRRGAQLIEHLGGVFT
jgi:3-(3-hydroxy-phenyl)propionate hydroxylase